MSDRPVLQELARTLSEQERRRLLQKIQSSITLEDDKQGNIYKKSSEDTERENLISNDLQRASFFTRIKIWFRKLFSGKDRREIFLNIKLQYYKKRIQQKAPGVVSFETRSLQPKCAQIIFRVYLKVLPLIRLFRSLWKESQKFEESIFAIIEKRIGSPKQTIEDFLSMDEMEKLYIESSSKNVLRERLIQAIEIYVQSVPDEIFESIEQQVRPVFYLKDLVLFPYNDFFRMFQVAYSKEDNKPVFKSTSAVVALDHLESMYYALYLISKIDKKEEIDRDFSEKLCERRGDEKEDEPDPCEDLKGRNIRDIMYEIINEAANISRQLPFVDIIRYYRDDPYYQLIFYIPTLNLREFYLSKLELELLPQLDEYFPRVRENVINKKIDELFPSEKMETLMYYRDYSSMEYEKIGLPTFAFTRSINIMYNFIKIYYRRKSQNIVRIISQGILRGNRLTLNKLLLHSSAIEDLQEKIKLFDNSVSTDEDDGKLFQRIRHSIATDAGHQRLYRSLLQQKDNEVKSLIEKGKESFLGIKQIFEELANSSMEAVKQTVHSQYYIDNTTKSLYPSQ
jgi:hypothetical protein